MVAIVGGVANFIFSSFCLQHILLHCTGKKKIDGNVFFLLGGGSGVDDGLGVVYCYCTADITAANNYCIRSKSTKSIKTKVFFYGNVKWKNG